MEVAFGKIKITLEKFVGKALAGYTRKDYCLGILGDIYAHRVLIENTNSNNKLDKFLCPLCGIYVEKEMLKIFKKFKEKL